MNRVPWKQGLQILVTLGLLIWSLAKLDWPRVLHTLALAQPAWIVAGMAIYLVSLSVSALRWRAILRSLERPVPLLLLVNLNWVGAFFNQVLPGAVSGDAVRALYSRRHTCSLPLAAAAVFGERLLGLGMLLALALFTFLILGEPQAGIPSLGPLLSFLALGYLAGMGALLKLPFARLTGRTAFVRDKLQELRQALGSVFHRGPNFFWVLILSLLIQILSVVMFWSVSRALALHLDQVALWVIWPVVSLLTVLPISFGGWGLREGLMVFYLTHSGFPVEQVLALSILAGLIVMLASLPGGLVWALLGERRKVAPVESPS